MPAFFLKRVGNYKLKLNSNIYVQSMHASLMDFANQVVIPLYESTTDYWRHHPTFEITLDTGGISKLNIMQVVVYTDDRIYQYLDDGTSVRWAKMSRDWQSKTQPNVIQSGPGAGRATIRGRSAMLAHGYGPQPGITARNFSRNIRDMLDHRWRLDMRYANHAAVSLMRANGGW